MKIINYIVNVKGNAKLKKVKFQKADVFKTHGSNKKILKVIKFKKLSNTFESINKIINWHNKTDY